MMTHWPRTPVDIGGHRYDLCFSLGAVAEAQQRFDIRGIDVNLLEVMPELNLANMRILFPCTTRKYHPDLDFAAAQRLVTWEAVYVVAGAVIAAWRAAAPDPVAREERQVRPEKPAKPLSKDKQWQRLWSLAVYDLRLTTSEFYGLTFGQLEALIRRYERATQEREFLFAQLAALHVNFSMAHPKEPVQARDFMPSEWAKKRENNEPAHGWKRMSGKRRQAVAAEIGATMEYFMRNQRD